MDLHVITWKKWTDRNKSACHFPFLHISPLVPINCLQSKRELLSWCWRSWPSHSATWDCCKCPFGGTSQKCSLWRGRWKETPLSLTSHWQRHKHGRRKETLKGRASNENCCSEEGVAQLVKALEMYHLYVSQHNSENKRATKNSPGINIYPVPCHSSLTVSECVLL